MLTKGWSTCPSDVARAHSCLNTTDWRLNIPYSTKMTTTMRRASTIFDRYNFTILGIKDLSDAAPTDYGPTDFFPFYDSIFFVDPSEPNWFQTTQYMLVVAVATYLGVNVGTQQATGSDDRLLKMQEFLAVPIFLFNNVAFGGPTSDMGTSISLARSSYKVLSSNSRAH